LSDTLIQARDRR